MHSELFLNAGRGLPRFAGDGELPFFNTYADRAGEGTSPGWNAQRRLLPPFLDEAFRARAETGAVGFKLMYSQVERLPQLLAHLAWRRVKVLHLVRENLLDIYLSRMAREARGFAHASDGQDVEQVSLAIDCGEMERFLRKVGAQQEAWKRELTRVGFERHDVVYERLAKDADLLNEALRFLGQGPANSSGAERFHKLAQRPRREQIINIDEVSRALERGPWQHMLDA